MMLSSELRTLHHLVLFCVTAGHLSLMNVELRASEIRSDERVIFFPTLARLSEDGEEWILPVHGWIFEPEENDLLRGAGIDWAADALSLPRDSSENEVFRSRIRWFLVDNERGKQITISIAGRVFVLPPSSPAGHFSLEIRLPVAVVAGHIDAGWLSYHANLDEGDNRQFAGRIRLLDHEEIVVISDIDDTVKITEVTSHRRLLARTFLEPFETVPGMAEVYLRWEDEGATIHFVSNGPWQLYPDLEALLENAGFPRATWSMRNFRLHDRTGVDFLLGGDTHKLTEITRCIRDNPRRAIILVGDTGERDPEIYAQVANEFSEQVKLILLRNVTGEPIDAPRFQQAFEGIAADHWMLFEDADMLDDVRIE